MSWPLLASALAALALGLVVRWFMQRGWTRYTAYPNTIVFPKICPVCLGPPDTVARSWALCADLNVQKYYWWTAKIPHCSNCQREQARDRMIGLLLGGICSLAAFMLMPVTDPPGMVIFYACFVYPFFVMGNNARRGLVFGGLNAEVITMRIRHTGYSQQFITLNTAPSPPGEEVLAGTKSVWRH